MKPRKKRVIRSFMRAQDFRHLRADVIHVTQAALASELMHPATGERLSQGTVCRWEQGKRPVPLWAARKLRAMAAAATVKAEAK